MKTYKPKITASKGLVESLTVALAIGLTTHIPALADYQELSIVLIAALLRMALNTLKHRFGIDLQKLAGN
jgi:hypothetical protein